MKKIYLLPNIITAFSLTCGLFVIFKMTMTNFGQVDQHILMATAGIMLLAAFADLLDGAVARAMKAESEFGGIFDSLADAVTFGVAPAVIVLKTASLEQGSQLSAFLTIAAMIFSVCGVLRLARFSASAQQARGDEELLAANKKNFTGLPIPAGAAAMVSANLFLASNDFNHYISISLETQAWFLISAFVVLGYFMISRWKFPSFKSLHVRVASFQLVFCIVVAAVLIFYGIVQHFPLLFFILSWTYVLIAWTLSLIRLISGKKSKTLEDFEPEPEDTEWHE
ncbi:CDP-alcohol phosphatidyltransferase family protein [Parachlamydia acanthamoebae]|uniref:CDP-diacylglycerol--serine O-phosphatidyltransferase n=2 Tax=Parachlamydia acanthamoebae TaxID=83552 RepID=F8L0D4_PARAV|nr:phosphatidylcholine/phosphatidylserine synthase [Parachlamydia acanthamoebae]CCB86664.1 putative uncharacterized protein [Parachlamydia acanthamoebae UV-7]